MLYVVFFLFLFVLNSVFRISVFEELNFLSYFLHLKCMNLLPYNIQSHDTLAALVCGHNFESQKDSSLYVSTGLIHLFVVSGTHLMFIYRGLRFLFNNRSTRRFEFIILFLYAGVCLFNPPIVRSLLTLIALEFLKSRQLLWRTDYVLLLCGLVCLTLQPKWIQSLSLQMSWLAALCLELTSRYFKDSSTLARQSPFYGIYYLTYLGLGLPQFAIVAVGLIFNPFLENILFPLALLVCLLPLVGFLFDFCIQNLNAVLNVLEFHPHIPLVPVSSVVLGNWFFIMGLHFVLHFKRVKS